MKMKYLIFSIFLASCMGMQPREISTQEALWMEDPKSGELLYCKTKGPNDLPICYYPARLTP